MDDDTLEVTWWQRETVLLAQSHSTHLPTAILRQLTELHDVVIKEFSAKITNCPFDHRDTNLSQMEFDTFRSDIYVVLPVFPSKVLQIFILFQVSKQQSFNNINTFCKARHQTPHIWGLYGLIYITPRLQWSAWEGRATMAMARVRWAWHALFSLSSRGSQKLTEQMDLEWRSFF